MQREKQVDAALVSHIDENFLHEAGVEGLKYPELCAKRRVDSVTVEWGKAKYDLGDDFKNGGIK